MGREETHRVARRLLRRRLEKQGLDSHSINQRVEQLRARQKQSRLTGVPMPVVGPPPKERQPAPVVGPRTRCSVCARRVGTLDGLTSSHRDFNAGGVCAGSNQEAPLPQPVKPPRWEEPRLTTDAESNDRHAFGCPAGDGRVFAGEWSRVLKGRGVYERWHEDCAERAGAPVSRPIDCPDRAEVPQPEQEPV